MVRRESMQTMEQSAGMCRSVFRNTSPVEIRKAYHLRWIELINRLERQKQTALPQKA